MYLENNTKNEKSMCIQTLIGNTAVNGSKRLIVRPFSFLELLLHSLAYPITPAAFHVYAEQCFSL